MGEIKAPLSNRYSLVKNVGWYSDCFWGSHEWLAQEMVGMSGPRKNGHKNELDTKKCPLEDLLECFEEFELEDGRLGFRVLLGPYASTLVAHFETDFRYGDLIDDETMLKIIDDYVAYVHSLPLADPSQAITPEEREREMQEANTAMFETLLHVSPRTLEMMLLADMKADRERREKPWKDVEF